MGYDKVIVTHAGALRAKYGAAGWRSIRSAIDALIVADRARGLRDRLLLLDNTTAMRALKASPVAAGDWATTRRVIDRACTRDDPAYLMLVGADDVVPQCRVRNPVGDADPYVPCDLPYACDIADAATLPTRPLDPATLLAMTRVVGRLPDVAGGTDPSYLLGLLETARTATSRPAGDYLAAFVLTAQVWVRSTRLSAQLLPGRTPTVRESPPGDSRWTARQLGARTHLINCHGADTTPDWFGQADGGPVDIVALRAENLAGKVRSGTIVAAECCYGAMHQRPADQGGRMPTMWAYLAEGAHAAVGASTVSYGPAVGNGQADLMCRFALEAMLGGASAGRAMLEARQRFVREVAPMTPADLKTLAQFDLLADPSVQPVLAAQAVGPAPKSGARSTGGAAPAGAAPAGGARAGRRRALAASGRALDASVPRAGQRRTRRSGGRDLARRAGLRSSAAVDDRVEVFGESAAGPRAGVRYQMVAVRDRGRRGYVVAREFGGEAGRDVTTIWAR